MLFEITQRNVSAKGDKIMNKYYFSEFVGAIIPENEFVKQYQENLNRISPEFVFEINPCYEYWIKTDELAEGKVIMASSNGAEGVFILSEYGYIPLYPYYPSYPL